MNQSIRLEPDTVFAKTPTGREEIQIRELKLPPLVRRLLVLVHGKRSLQELSGFVPGHDASAWLHRLSSLGCIEAVASGSGAAMAEPAPPHRVAAEPPAESPATNGLPPPASRSARETDMARYFMINTINRMLEQNSRLSLVEHIFNSPDAVTLRQHYADWETAIGSSWMGARRLPELRKKLFEEL